MSEQLLTPAQAGVMFGVCVTTVRNWAEAGRLTALRTPSGQRRYRYAEVRALLDGQTVQGVTR